MSPMLEAALFYARQGWAVLPLQSRGKIPLTAHGMHDATTDEETILAWWSKWPEANVGIATGKCSNLVVIDIDGPKGERALADLLRKRGATLPETLVVKTGKGRHIYFRKTRGPFPRCSASKIARGIDVRSDGGYVVAAPSVHANGQTYFCVTRVEPADLPDWLDDLLMNGSTPLPAGGSAPVRVTEGARNSTLASLAGKMRRQGKGFEAIREGLLNANSSFEPPLDESEAVSVAASISRYPAGKAAEDPQAGTVEAPTRDGVMSPVHAEVRRIILTGDIHGFDKRRHVEEVLRKELTSKGEFFRTADGKAFYFNNEGRQLIDVEQVQFRRLTSSVSGLSATENYLLFAIDLLQTRAHTSARVVDVHSFSHYDVSTGVVVVSDGGSGAWRREIGGEWQPVKNGDDDIFFLSDSEASPWSPSFNAPTALEDLWLSRFLLSADQGLSPADGRNLIGLWLCHQFFPPLRRTRLIPCFLGGQGSGKTTGMRLVGRLLVGPNFEVTGIQRDKEDAFVAAVTGRTVLALDNIDSRVPWLADSLALYATGQRHRMRKLYTTNEEVSYPPRATVMLSSRDPRFNRPDVTERLLPLHFARPPFYRSEEEIFGELDNQRGEILGALLIRVGTMADVLARTKPTPVPHRMADFASFGVRVSQPDGDADAFLERLARLESQQSSFAADNDGLIVALQRVLQAGDVIDEPVSELFKRCSAIAEEFGLAIPRTAQGFGRQLSSLRRVIELELGASFSERRGHGGQRTVCITRK